MKWLLQRLVAGLAAVLVVVLAAGLLLAWQFRGEEEPWAGSMGADAAWLGDTWVDAASNPDAEQREALMDRLAQAELAEVYVHVGELSADGQLDPDGYAGAEEFVAAAAEAAPETAVLGWISHHPERSALTEDRFAEEARTDAASAAGEVAAAGFAGVHYAISPVTTNDPSLPQLMAETREELDEDDEDTVLSVQSQHLELIPGLRLPVFLAGRSEFFWSTGYLERVAEHADGVVVPGQDTRMPLDSLYGGFMVRQTTLALDTVAEDTSLRFGAPAYQDEQWGATAEAETVATATEAVRLGWSRSQERQPDDVNEDNEDTTESGEVGMALYLLDEASAEQRTEFADGWTQR